MKKATLLYCLAQFTYYIHAQSDPCAVEPGAVDYESQIRACNAGAPAPEPAPSSSDPAPAPPSSPDPAAPPSSSSDNAPAASPTSSTEVSPASPSSSGGYGDNYYEVPNTCVNSPENDMSTVLYQCRYACSWAVIQQQIEGKTSSVSCISHGGANEISPGTCSCNNPLIDELGDDFIKSLEAIGKIAGIVDKVMKVFEAIIAVGSLIIPGVGEALDAGLLASIAAAKLTEWTYNAGKLGAQAFKEWGTKLGKVSDDFGKNYEKVFNSLRGAPDDRLPGGVFRAPPGVARGSGKAGDEGCPSCSVPKNEPAPKPEPKPDQGPKPNDPAKPPENKPNNKDDEDCVQKRAQGGNKNAKCKPKDKVTVTSIKTSKAVKYVTVTSTCKAGQWPQACAHYYSGIQEWGKEWGSALTCIDNTRKPKQRDNFPATRTWYSDHSPVWQSYKTDSFATPGAVKSALKCQADEWPPAYFLSKEVKDRIPRGAKSPKDLGQIVRLIPAAENGGAGGLWKGFCKEHDGGQGNSQLLKNGKINRDLVKVRGNPKRHGKGKTVTEVYESVEYTRAVFSLAFDDKWPKEKPTKKNLYLLKENPCWPQAIIPDDPGFNILKEDPAQALIKPNPQRNYREDPAQALINQNAKVYLKKNPQFNPGLAKVLGVKRKNRRDTMLSVIEDGSIVLTEVNMTRRLTELELQENIEIIECADSTCSKENIGHLDLVIPGTVSGPDRPQENQAVLATPAAPAPTPTQVALAGGSNNRPQQPKATTLLKVSRETVKAG